MTLRNGTYLAFRTVAVPFALLSYFWGSSIACDAAAGAVRHPAVLLIALLLYNVVSTGAPEIPTNLINASISSPLLKFPTLK